MEELNERNAVTCIKCNELKHVSEFGLTRGTYDNRCLACMRKYQRERKQRLMDAVDPRLLGKK